MAIDKDAIKEHIRGILVALGDNPDREGSPRKLLKELQGCMRKFSRG